MLTRELDSLLQENLGRPAVISGAALNHVSRYGSFLFGNLKQELSRAKYCFVCPFDSPSEEGKVLLYYGLIVGDDIKSVEEKNDFIFVGGKRVVVYPSNSASVLSNAGIMFNPEEIKNFHDSARKWNPNAPFLR
jgi:hypothetical protein